MLEQSEAGGEPVAEVVAQEGEPTALATMREGAAAETVVAFANSALTAAQALPMRALTEGLQDAASRFRAYSRAATSNTALAGSKSGVMPQAGERARDGFARIFALVFLPGNRPATRLQRRDHSDRAKSDADATNQMDRAPIARRSTAPPHPAPYARALRRY